MRLSRISPLLFISIFLCCLGLSNAFAQTCAQPPSGLVSWWAAEGDATDITSTNNGTLEGGASFGSGEVGQAFSFDGGNQYVRVPDSPSLHFSTAMTAEAWVNPTQVTGHDLSILVKYDSGFPIGQSSFSFSIAPDFRAYMIISQNGVNGTLVESITTVPTNQWTHLAATYDGSALQIYVNGNLEATTSTSGNIFSGADDLGIGANIGGGVTAPFAGLIDEPTLYDRALSSTEIQAIFQAGISGKCQPELRITTQPMDQIITEGQNASFVVGVTAEVPISYQWFFNSVSILGATNATLTLTNVQMDQAGPYQVAIISSNDTLLSSSANLTVLAPPPCFPASTNIVSWWSAESNTFDNVGGNNGVFLGGPKYGTGEVGSAFSFNGTSQYIRVPDAPNLRFSNAMTAEAWVFPAQTLNHDQSILVKFDAVGSGQSAFSFSIAPNNATAYMIISTNGRTGTLVKTVHVVPMNTWTYLATTYDGTNLSIYLNGSLEASTPLSGNIFPGTDALGIGANIGDVPDGQQGVLFSGLIDEPSLYNVALTSDQIQNIYNYGPGGKCPLSLPPVVYVQPTNITAAVSKTVIFKASATGSDNLYQWRFNGTNISGATNSFLTLANIQPTNSGTYALFATNALGSSMSSNATLVVSFLTTVGNGQTLTNSQYTFGTSAMIQLQNFYANGDVFYTLDGSVPTPGSALYSGSILTTTDVIIRALAYSPDFQFSYLSSPIAITVVPSCVLTASTPGGGTITEVPSGLVYLTNTTVTVKATPNAGWKFLGWLGDIAGSNPTNTVLMSKNKSIQAVFGTSVAGTASGGSIMFNPQGGTYPYGTSLQATAIPSAGNVFVVWGNSASGNTNPLPFLVTNANPMISALFTSLSGGQVSLAVVPLGHGKVSVNPRANGYTAGQSVTITATPDAGKTFNGWSGGATGNQNPLPVMLNTSEIIYANFNTNNSVVFHNGPGPGLSEGFEVDINGEQGTHYRLDVSTNLANWTSLLNATNFIGTVHFIDTNASNINARFYRSVIVP